LKKPRQKRSRLERRPASAGRFGAYSSLIPTGTSHVGLCAQMIESGTTMQRDQYDIL
jgi:hypothetical protein